MALPSAVTLGSLAFVVAAGIGLAAVASNASEDPTPRHSANDAHDAHDGGESGASSTKSEHPAEKPAPPEHKARKHHKRADPVPQVFVEVYNNSGLFGLAADKAHVLERAGWNVTATDNWYGNIPASTVYYPEKLRRPAHQLAQRLHITRIRPAVSPMRFDRLTVILTSR